MLSQDEHLFSFFSCYVNVFCILDSSQGPTSHLGFMGNPGSPCVSQPPTQSSAPASPNSHRLAITPAGPASSLVDCIQPLLPPLPNTSLSMPQSKLPSSHSTYSEQRLRRPERAGKHPAIPTAYPARLTLLHPQRPWHSYSLASRALAPPRPLLTRPDHPVKSHS